MTGTQAAFLVYSFGALSALLLSIAYARDAASWFHVLRSGAPVVRPAIVDQVFFMLSFLVAGSTALFAAVLHFETFGLTALTVPLATMSTVMLFFGSWFMLRRYQARPVAKIFGVDAAKFEDGASLIPSGDRGRVRAEPWHFFGATLHGLGDWREERKAAHRISAEVAANLASRGAHKIDRNVNPTRGLFAAITGMVPPLGLSITLFTMLFTSF